MSRTAIEMIDYIGTSDKEKRFKRILSLINQTYIVEADQQSRNIIIPARIQTEKIAITAHWDTYPRSKGYNDNASGVVTLLRLQNELSDKFEIVFTDNEEIGGRGSALYLDNGHRPSANINLDVVGLGGRIFFERYGDFKLEMPMGASEHRNVPFNDSHVFHNMGVPSILFVTGTRAEGLIMEIRDAQHGGRNDNQLDLLSDKALEGIYAYVKGMIVLNSEAGVVKCASY